jgi:ADP-ribose pyrophosphatase YjhB (NUDIX family)
MPSSLQTPSYCIYCGNYLQPHAQAGELRPICLNCGWVYYEDPKVAVAALITKDKKVLLVRRAIQPAIGSWTLPAGFLNAHEDPADAVIRECLEETGLQVKVGDIITVLSGREHPRGADILLVYQAEITGGDLHASDDADAVDFFDPDHLPPLAFTSTSKILKHLKF